MRKILSFVALLLFMPLSGCEKEEEATPKPIANFDLILKDSLNSSRVVFVNKSDNGESYFWDFGDGNSSTAENPSHFYTNGGLYTIRLMVKNPSGVSRIAKTVQIVGAPEAAFDFLGGNCDAPCQVTFINNSKNATSFKWDFGDGNTSILKAPSYTYKEPGLYTVRLVALSATGADELTRTVRIGNAQFLPNAAFKVVNNDCKGPCELVFVNESTNATSYLWDFGDGNTSPKAEPTHRYAKAGIYTVVLSASGAGTVSRVSQTISIK